MRNVNFIPNLLNDIVDAVATSGNQFTTYSLPFFDTTVVMTQMPAGIFFLHNRLFHFLDYLVRIYFHSALDLSTWEDETTGVEQDNYSLMSIDPYYYDDPVTFTVEQYINIIMQSNES